MRKTKSFKLMMLIAVNLALLILLSDLSTIQSYAINLGENGVRVAELQKCLKEKGYYRGDINGLYDFSTRNAVKKFKKENGIGENEDYKTFSLLGLYSTNNGCYSLDVELLAKHLKHNGIIEYHFMIEECENILSDSKNGSLCKYIVDMTDDTKRYLNEKPNSEQYAAAVNVIKRNEKN